MRLVWEQLPLPVRHGIEEILGSTVVSATSQPGGFSPGTADRVVTAQGRRAFVKAVSPAQNERTPVLHRQEALVSAALPRSVPVPALLGVYDDGEWIALVLEDVDGRHPVLPWDSVELAAVLSTLDAMAVSLTPSPVQARSAAEVLRNDFGGWSRVRAEPPELAPWVAARLDRFCDLSEQALSMMDGDTLCHLDLRADNVLLGADGRVAVVDWPHAGLGAPWLDRALLLFNVIVHGGLDTEPLLATLPVSAAEVHAVAVALTGYFIDVARRPPPAGIPTLREFQRRQGEALLAWLSTVDADT